MGHVVGHAAHKLTRMWKKDIHGKFGGALKEATGAAAKMRAAKADARNLIDSTNEAYAEQRRRQRSSGASLATGAAASGTAATSSAMAYGLPTLGG